MMLPAMAPRTVLLIGALSLTAGWLMGSSASSSRQEAQASRQPSGARALGTSPTVPAAQAAELDALPAATGAI